MKENKITNLIHRMPAHRRLLICLFVAFITFIITRNTATPAFQFMYIWSSFTLSTLILFWITIFTANPEEIKQIAKKQDSSRTIIFLFVLIASFVSLFAVILLLKDLPDSKQRSYYHIFFSGISVILSWVLIHTIFTIRYAHLYYTCKTLEKDIQKQEEGGLDFPNDERPDYLDFAYFSFVVGMTFQVSDMQITSYSIRRVVLLHGLLSFAYNTVILALCINIIAGLVQK